MKWIVATSATLTALGLLGPYGYMLMPPSAKDDNGGSTETVKARDLNGKVLSAVEWIATHKPNDRELVMVSTDRYDSITYIFNEFKCMRNSLRGPWVSRDHLYFTGSDTQLHRTRVVLLVTRCQLFAIGRLLTTSVANALH
eukprot:15248-Heterococcus_DN1.PRE.2